MTHQPLSSTAKAPVRAKNPAGDGGVFPEDTMTDALAKLRLPFPDNQISKLPKETKRQAEERKANPSNGINCQLCGGWHHRSAVHLDYVGHAALTDRLLDCDPHWSWEPVAFGPDGLPAIDRSGGMWIKLTVCGVTRLGYGSADGKSGGDAVKELIGDALRNAAMRFGAALDLWHKGDLHAHNEDADTGPAEPSAAAQFAADFLRQSKTADEFKHFWSSNKDSLKQQLNEADYAHVVRVMQDEAKRFAAPKADEATPIDEAA